MEIVGLTKTNKYLLYRGAPDDVPLSSVRARGETRMSLMVETFGDPAAIAAPLREVVRTIDANQPVYNVRTFSSFYEQRAISVAMI